jgi:hypothetical protein
MVETIRYAEATGLNDILVLFWGIILILHDYLWYIFLISCL